MSGFADLVVSAIFPDGLGVPEVFTSAIQVTLVLWRVCCCRRSKSGRSMNNIEGGVPCRVQFVSEVSFRKCDSGVMERCGARGAGMPGDVEVRSW